MKNRYIVAEAKKKILNAAPGTVILLYAPVGSGKTTFCIDELWTYCRAWRKRMLLLVNRSALRGQLRQKILKKLDLKEGNGICERGILEFDGLTVTSYQYVQEIFCKTFGMPNSKIGSQSTEKFDFVVCDEIHYLIVDSMFSLKTQNLNKIPMAFPRAVRVYMSATIEPVRNMIFKMENIVDQYEMCSEDWKWKYIPFRYLDVSLEKKVTAHIWQRKRNVLELEAAEADYSYLRPVFYEETRDIADLIIKQYADGDTGKWLVFIDSKADGQEKKEKLINAGIRAAFISADKMMDEDEQERDSILKRGMFDVQVLLATSVVDNGISIIDKNVTHIVISGYEQIQAIQQAGRVRWKGKREPIELYICRHTAEYFNRKRFRLKEKLYAYEVIARGNETQIVDFLVNKGNESMSGIAYKGAGGKWQVNDFTEKALEYFSNELSENIALLKEGKDGYVGKVLGWFGLSYNPANDLLQQRQAASRQQLIEFLLDYKDILVSGEKWDDFRVELRKLYESATGVRLCSGRIDRVVGVSKVREIIAEFGYILDSSHKEYVVREVESCI